MRIATSTMMNMATSGTTNAYNNYYGIISKIISGKNFTSMSQDVVGGTKVLKLNDQLAKLNEYQSNIKTAINEMSFTYDTLNNVNEELTNINSLIVQASNSTTTPDSAKAIAEDIKEKVQTIISEMNAKYQDNYIFSGTNTQTRTYQEDEDGNIVYKGSSVKAEQRNLTIAEGKTFAYNVSGDSIFEKDADGKDFFSEMKELDELLNPKDGNLDIEKIRAKLDVVKKAQDNVIQTTGAISSKVSKLDTTQGINDAAILTLTENKSEIEDIDIAKLASELASARNALQASYSVSSVVLSGASLLDYL